MVSASCPPIGVEAVGIGPEVGMPVCVERREHDRGPGRHVEATDLVVLDGIPRVERRARYSRRTSLTT